MKKIYLLLYFFIQLGQILWAQEGKVICLTIEQPELPILYHSIDIKNPMLKTDYLSGVDIKYNESQKIICLNFNGIIGSAIVDIYDMKGQKVRNLVVENPQLNSYVEVDFERYALGMYVVSVAGRNYIKTQKIYVSR